ncbi:MULTISPECIES: thioesterase family protein [Leptospira]|uniref:acyl-CoA thioesterase n=1 Tax=Leptospira TaxID=171 RepID=UPI000292756C|nr:MULTISPECIES: thioesterase family protein [Leptospira]EKO77519.1 acyl-CoA thioester hydrolase, YbgC/YbaW family [Leptospira sp. Fiocruz LV3954]EMI67059.1 acyl-CoA thioester hydrolase, YbgC/YbaW family [Leptospira sp. Fiocruz LV4135]EMM86763.1 acyl-CoA thioester hydrolase, YbgC/YbaW family [Leptospira santarosai str. 2000027870]
MAKKAIKEEFDFFHTIRVRYAESDPQGIVFNANYLTYFDVAITEYFRFQGHPYGDLASSYGIDFHVVHCSIDYKSPAKFDDEIEIHVRGSYSGVKVFWDLAIFKEEILLCSGKLIYAGVDVHSGDLKKISIELASLLKWNLKKESD